MTGASRRRGDAPRIEHDTKGQPKGLRTGVAPAVCGVVEYSFAASGQRVDATAYDVAQVERRRAGDGRELLEPLFRLCERYHRARTVLDKARDHATAAVDAYHRAANSSVNLPTGLRARPAALAEQKMHQASLLLDVAAADVATMPGLGAVSLHARDAATAVRDLLRTDPSTLQVFDALTMWRDAFDHLRPLRDRRRVHDVRDVLRKHPTEAEIFDVHTRDADSPLAPGALGCERIVELSKPWAASAWLGWRAAGLGTKVFTAWATWRVLDQFAHETIGAVAGARGRDAVRKTRQRNPSI